MNKRLLTVLLLSLCAVLACQRDDAAGAKPGAAAPRVIAMVQLTAVDRNTVGGFQAAMTKLGYEDGKQVTYLDAPPAGSVDKLDGIIRGHLDKKPDLLLVSSTPATLAVKRLTAASGKPSMIRSPPASWRI
jgi:ABC-type uncharacterized transport system substrate-binding protein